MKSVNLALFASGSGSNVENINNHFKNNAHIKISVVICNNPNAYVIERCKKLQLDCVLIDKERYKNPAFLLQIFEEKKIDYIILAGFLWLIPKYLVDAYPQKIVNIHPALLPKFGGKGMYGMHVHQAVANAKENETGISIHYVNEHYDEGNIIFQSKVEVLATDTPEMIAEKVHKLEYEHFPKVIEKVIEGKI